MSLSDLKNMICTTRRKGEQKMEIGDLLVFAIALGIVVAGGVMTIREILKGGEKD